MPSIGVLALAIVTLGLWLLPRWWHRGSKLYRVTTRRIVVETGVLSKRLEQIDLYRIADYTVDRPFGQRVLGTGNLLLKTFDKSTPELNVHEIKPTSWRCTKNCGLPRKPKKRAATCAWSTTKPRPKPFFTARPAPERTCCSARDLSRA